MFAERSNLLNDNNTDDGAPSYSPSGKKIVYSGEDGANADYEIYTIKPGGGGKFKGTDNNSGDYIPLWGSSY